MNTARPVAIVGDDDDRALTKSNKLRIMEVLPIIFPPTGIEPKEPFTLKGIEPKEMILLALDKIGWDGTSRWIMILKTNLKTKKRKKMGNEYYVKIKCGTGESDEYIRDRKSAMRMALESGQNLHQCLSLITPKRIVEGIELDNLNLGIRDCWISYPEWMVIEVQTYHGADSQTLAEYITHMGDSPAQIEAQSVYATEIARKLEQLHGLTRQKVDLCMDGNHALTPE